MLAQVAAAIPSDLHPNVIIIGSLAAGYWLLRGDESLRVRTKDIDCVLSPHVTAVESGRTVAEKLLTTGLQPKTDGEFVKPGDATTPTNELPSVRLHPPGSKSWFLELLTEPATNSQTELEWTRLKPTG